MTIQDAIDGKSTTCPQDWADLQSELTELESEMDRSYKNCERSRYYHVKTLYRNFRLTDTGYMIIRGY